MAKQVRIGCSGWNYTHWRERVYPKGLPARRWLEHYATLFDTVEVNATFYRLPTKTAAEGWAKATPGGFTFAIKASRYLTHVKRLREVAARVPRLIEPLEPLSDTGKLGPILWQLPENFHRDDDRLAEALAGAGSGRHCFEFRHPSWFVPEVEDLLRAHDAALVIADHAERPFQTQTLTADWTYLRFHHGRGKDGSYTPSQLRSWASRIREWQANADVYAYFNDDWRGYALQEAVRLRELLAHADD